MLTITISTRAAVLSAILLALAIASVPFAISRAEDGAQGAVDTRIPVSTAFQYQGRLDLDGIPANGQHTLGFTLYSDAVASLALPSLMMWTLDGVFTSRWTLDHPHSWELTAGLP